MSTAIFLSIILQEQTFRNGPDWFFSIRVSVQLTVTKKTLNETRLKTGKKYVRPENRFFSKSLKWRPFLQECVYWGEWGGGGGGGLRFTLHSCGS